VSRRSGSAGEILLTVVLAWLVAYPILVVFAAALHGSAFAAFVHRPAEWRALWSSVWISSVSVALAAVIGVPRAFLF
jgi:ABC-type Fe3+ transport system permease subunit